MCWSERASSLSFAIGTITILSVSTHLVAQKRYDLVYILIAWQFGLLMQIPEWMEWRNIRLGRRSDEFIAQSAFWLNVSQPLALLIAVSYITKKPPYTAIGVFVIYVLSFVADNRNVRDAIHKGIAPTSDCRHLNLGWWPLHRGILFHVTMIAAFAHLQWNQAVLNIGIFETTFLLSMFVKCGTVSVWCWSTFVAAVATYIAVFAKVL